MMSLEHEVIKLLSNRDKYNTYFNYVDEDYISSECNTILINLGIYFDTFSTTDDIPLSDFKSWLMGLKKTSASGSLKRSLTDLIEGADKITTPNPEVFKTLCKRHYGNLIYDVAYDVIEERAEIEDIAEIVESYEDELSTVEGPNSKIISGKITDVLAARSTTRGLPWNLKVLQQSLGDLRKGDFLIVGGRPDAGKTTFLADVVRSMLPHMEGDEVVLWFNNEEDGAKVYKRILQCVLGITNKDLNKDLASAEKAAQAVMDRILIYDDSSISITDINKQLRGCKPGLIIIDQLSKLHGFENKHNDAERIRQLAETARGWAKTHAPVIVTVWADGSSEGQKWIDMSQLYGSKTGLQGEADAIITIGRENVHSGPHKNVRFFHVPKNKMEGEDPLLRNLKAEVTLLPETARFKE
jgi:KaiC/GvpD/RAD55 family RecA-like ATPase